MTNPVEAGPFNPDTVNGPTEVDEEEVLQQLYGKAIAGRYFGEDAAQENAVVLAGSARSLLNEAVQYLGVRGRPNRFTEWYAKTRKHGNAFLRAPWCDMFVTYVAFHSNTYNAVCPKGDRAYTVWHAQDFEGMTSPALLEDVGTVNWALPANVPSWIYGTAGGVAQAAPGWIVFFDWGGTNSIGKIDHIGIVEQNIGGGRVQTIEGNTSDSVARRIRSVGDIVGFGIPRYVAIPEPPQTAKPIVPLGKPFLRMGDKGTRVAQLQKALFYVGYKFPKFGIDGDFGRETESVVKAFQRAKRLSVDGIYGPKTAEKLKGEVNKR